MKRFKLILIFAVLVAALFLGGPISEIAGAIIVLAATGIGVFVGVFGTKRTKKLFF